MYRDSNKTESSIAVDDEDETDNTSQEGIKTKEVIKCGKEYVDKAPKGWQFYGYYSFIAFDPFTCTNSSHRIYAMAGFEDEKVPSASRSEIRKAEKKAKLADKKEEVAAYAGLPRGIPANDMVIYSLVVVKNKELELNKYYALLQSLESENREQRAAQQTWITIAGSNFNQDHALWPSFVQSNDRISKNYEQISMIREKIAKFDCSTKDKEENLATPTKNDEETVSSIETPSVSK